MPQDPLTVTVEIRKWRARLGLALIIIAKVLLVGGVRVVKHK